MPINAADDLSIKKVLRIALVGIRSADQVMLKGYLRVILRLEADLEWVSANHPNIDLFMINQEFRHADSVVKLLNSKADTAALYIDRAANEQGGIVGDTLVLPLKEVNELSGWLYAHMASLGGNPQAIPRPTPPQSASVSDLTAGGLMSAATNPPSTQPSQPPTSQPAQPRTLDDILKHRAASSALTTDSTPTTTPAAPDPAAQATAQPTAVHNTSQRRAFIQLICQVHDRSKIQDKIWAIQNLDGQTLVYLAPKHQKIYTPSTDTAFAANSDWQLTTVGSLPSAVKPHAQDMVQWLWQQALTHFDVLAPVVDSLPASTLTSWVKPQADAHRHNRLLLQAIWERQALSPVQAAQRANIDSDTARHTWAALLAAGVLQDHVYQALAGHALAHAEPTAPSANLAAPLAPVAPITKPAASTPIPTPSQPAPTPSAPPVPSTSSIEADLPKGNMGGFLSRLRRKLGL